MSSETEAAEAIRLFQDREVDGRKLVVNAAEGRPGHANRTHSERPSPRPDTFGSGGSGAPPPRGPPVKRKGSRRGVPGGKRGLCGWRAAQPRPYQPPPYPPTP